MRWLVLFLLFWAPMLMAEDAESWFAKAARLDGVKQAQALDRAALLLESKEIKGAQDWYNLGQVRRAQKELPLALLAYRRSIAVNPDFAPSKVALAELAQQLEQSPDARSWSVPGWLPGALMLVGLGLAWPLGRRQAVLGAFAGMIGLVGLVWLWLPFWPAESRWISLEAQSLRLGPGAEYPPSGVLAAGEILRPDERWGNWISVKQEGETLWAQVPMLAPIKEAPTGRPD